MYMVSLVSIPQRSDLNYIERPKDPRVHQVSIPQRSDLNCNAGDCDGGWPDVSIPQRSDLNTVDLFDAVHAFMSFNPATV